MRTFGSRAQPELRGRLQPAAAPHAAGRARRSPRKPEIAAAIASPAAAAPAGPGMSLECLSRALLETGTPLQPRGDGAFPSPAAPALQRLAPHAQRGLWRSSRRSRSSRGRRAGPCARGLTPERGRDTAVPRWNLTAALQRSPPQSLATEPWKGLARKGPWRPFSGIMPVASVAAPRPPGAPLQVGPGDNPLVDKEQPGHRASARLLAAPGAASVSLSTAGATRASSCWGHRPFPRIRPGDGENLFCQSGWKSCAGKHLQRPRGSHRMMER
ncbi:uncharacterized protein LOC128813139 [Vidua macroura]|uniref:uncharacterized protein LOC128813139 n=1 Tax=Vidua macroura TaxID=187451 RepID=UPI0023A7F4DB|nr:uncharacterized protein LOC128813139 [Vidua macroura]